MGCRKEEDTKRGCRVENEAGKPILLPFTRKPGLLRKWQVF